MADLSLQDLWRMLKRSGATRYRCLAGNGSDLGWRGIPLGESHVLAMRPGDRQDYRILAVGEIPALAPNGRLDAEVEAFAASQTDGWFAAIYAPSDVRHRFRWRPCRPEAAAWAELMADRSAARDDRGDDPDPRVIKAREAFPVRAADGSRVYYQPREDGSLGYKPKLGHVDYTLVDLADLDCDV